MNDLPALLEWPNGSTECAKTNTAQRMIVMKRNLSERTSHVEFIEHTFVLRTVEPEEGVDIWHYAWAASRDATADMRRAEEANREATRLVIRRGLGIEEP